jgi:peroxiredoxin
MALTPSTMLPLGTQAPSFSLPDTVSGGVVGNGDFVGQPMVLMFICNHCPYVVHLQDALRDYAEEYQDSELAILAISANSVETHPQDGPEEMGALAAELGWDFPYLYDESQEVAKAYRAACTPEFYLFDEEHKLVYRGQFDGSRPGNGVAVDGRDLYGATHALLTGAPVDGEQTPGLGCNIKWHPGGEPAYQG